SLAEFFAELARQSGGAVLGPDDAQRIDDASLKGIAQLSAHQRAAPPLLLIPAPHAAPRSAAPAPILPRPGAALGERVSLGPLERTAQEALLSWLLGSGALELGLLERIISRAGGNPLSLAEYLQAFVDGAALRPTVGVWEVDRHKLAEVPLPND